MALISYSQLKEVLQDFKTNIQAKFVENITFDDSIDVATNKSKNTLKQTKNNQETVVINHVVEDWGDLEHTKYAPIQNIFDKTKTEQDKQYTPIAGQIGTILDNTDYVVGYVPCLAGEQFTIIKGATHDSRQAGVFNSQRQCIHNMNLSYRTVKGKQVYNVEIPANLADAAFFAFNMHKVHTNPNDVMVFKGILSDDEIPNEYYPNLGNYTTVIDADKVAIEFDSQHISLTSTTVVDAIKEISREIDALGSSSYQGKKILVYGDLFVNQLEWQNHVEKYLGATIVRKVHADAPLTQVKTSDPTLPLSSDTKLAELSDMITRERPDILLIMAGANDFEYDGSNQMANEGTMSLTNGNVDDFSSTTIKGSLGIMFTRLLLQHPEVQTLVCTFPNIRYDERYGTTEFQSEYSNAQGITTAQINNTIRETSLLFGVPCVDVYALCGISKLNRSQFLATHNTLNDLGHKAVANAVLGELLRMNKRIH